MLQPPLNPAGDRRMAEFIELFTAQQRHLYLYIFALVPHTANAEEVLQETNLTLWQKFDAFQPGSDFKAWATKIAHFKVLEFFRRQRSTPITADDELLSQLAGETERQVEGMDRWFPALQQCLAKLRDADRQLIRARYQAGADVGRIASEFGRPLRSVYKSIGRIRRTLLECVQRVVAAEGSP